MRQHLICPHFFGQFQANLFEVSKTLLRMHACIDFKHLRETMHENISHEMTTSKFLRNAAECNNGHGSLSNTYHCTFHSQQHLCANAANEKHDQYRLIGALLRSVPRLQRLAAVAICCR